MKSSEMRNNALFTRNQFNPVGKWNIPLVKKQEIPSINPSLVSINDTRSNDNEVNKAKGVHFFVDDYRFDGIYRNPDRSLNKLSQYEFLLTPDFSLYADMPMWKQIESVGKNRWCGAYWQSKGCTVIPTVSWSNTPSYDFCFDGIEQNAPVAVGMIGCKNSKLSFLRGYNAMLEKLNPSAVLCLGKPFDEMDGNIISVDYLASRKVVR